MRALLIRVGESVTADDSAVPLPFHNGHRSPAVTTSPAACKVSEGVRICVPDNPGSDDALASVGGAQGLLNRITPLGADPSRWTTHVVN